MVMPVKGISGIFPPVFTCFDVISTSFALAWGSPQQGAEIWLKWLQNKPLGKLQPSHLQLLKLHSCHLQAAVVIQSV